MINNCVLILRIWPKLLQNLLYSRSARDFAKKRTPHSFLFRNPSLKSPFSWEKKMRLEEELEMLLFRLSNWHLIPRL